jgi:hypothetical protein
MTDDRELAERIVAKYFTYDATHSTGAMHIVLISELAELIAAHTAALKAEIASLVEEARESGKRNDALRAEIKAERAAALRDAGDIAENMNTFSSLDGGLRDPRTVALDIKKEILSRIGPDQSALDHIVANVVLAEAELWADKVPLSCATAEVIKWRAERLTANRAVVEDEAVRQKESA